MTDPPDFGEFVQRIRDGDPDAAAELVRRFEPLIRREIRLRMTDPRLRRVLDSVDVCQSVLASFFLRAAAGHYDLGEPGRLTALLVRMARNKASNAVRAQNTQRRDVRRDGGGDDAARDAAAPGPSPSRVVAGKELLERFRAILTADERAIADMRAAGCGWAEIAEQLGGTVDGRRIQLTRAVRRATGQLGLDDSDDPP